jgi:ABC-2 type transport system ATP-binding protein
VTKVEEVPAPEAAQGEHETFLYHLYTEDAEALIPATVQTITSAHATLHDIHLVRPSLEDVFITLTGRNLRS